MEPEQSGLSFFDNGEVPVPPNLDNLNIPDNLTPMPSEKVVEALSGTTVKAALIPETMELLLPNYVLDFRKSGRLRKHQIMALSTMLCDEGDVAIYVCLPEGVDQIGMAISSKMDRVLPAGVASIFGKNCTLYKDVEPGKPLKRVSQNDINYFRLQL